MEGWRSVPIPMILKPLNKDCNLEYMDMNKAWSLRHIVRDAYSAAAGESHTKHPFPVGRRFAESVGYPLELLDDMPSVSVDAFSGVSNVSVFAEIPAEATVFDLGCGSGLDSLVAARRTGPKGKVIGVDFSKAMLERANRALAEIGTDNVKLRLADAERLPIRVGSIDIALVNGIFNLNPARQTIFSELARVVRQGGLVYAAELILREPLPPEFEITENNWLA